MIAPFGSRSMRRCRFWAQNSKNSSSSMGRPGPTSNVAYVSISGSSTCMTSEYPYTLAGEPVFASDSSLSSNSNPAVRGL